MIEPTVREKLDVGDAAAATRFTPDVDAQPSRAAAPGSSADDEVISVLRRIEALLIEMRGELGAVAREQEFRQFSPPRLIGGLLQVVVLGLVALALLNWVFGDPLDSLLTKLAFAAFFQLAALTAFVVASQRAS